MKLMGWRLFLDTGGKLARVVLCGRVSAAPDGGLNEKDHNWIIDKKTMV